MDLPQPLYRAHFDLMAQSAFKQLVCLLLTLFIDGYHPLQPLVEYARSFIRDDGNDGVYPPSSTTPVRYFSVFCNQAQLSTNCRQLGLRRQIAFQEEREFLLFLSASAMSTAQNHYLEVPPQRRAWGYSQKKDQNLYHRSTTSICLHRILILYHIPLLEASAYNDTAQKLQGYEKQSKPIGSLCF